MDPSSNSLEMCRPKVELDSENDSPKRDPRVNWTSENTMKLIDTLENECIELWDIKHPLYKDKNARQAKQDYLADTFGTTPEEISRKIHNLRTQLNNELRKIKRRQAASGAAGCGDGSARGSGWEYFDALSFLVRAPSGDPLRAKDGVSPELAELQTDEEEEFETPSISTSSTPTPLERSRPVHQVAASASIPLASILWPQEPAPRLAHGANTDDCQIFGDFVASELRTLRSDESRKKLKRMIQKAILQIGEEDDGNVING